MDRVWALNAISTPPTLPSSLEIGYPNDTSGVGTTVGAWWYYMVTEELRNAITTAGLIPAAGSVNQLSAAIVAIAQSSVGVSNRLPVRVIDTIGVAMTGLQTVDSVALVNGDRVLRNVSSAVNNGIWIVNSAGTWTQPQDYLNGAVILEGTMYEVSEGSINNVTVWALHSVSGENVTVGTTASQYVNITGTVTSSINAINNTLTTSIATLTAYAAAIYAPINNPIITGTLQAPTILATGPVPVGLGQINAVNGSGASWYNTMLRNDGSNCYLLQSAIQASELLANTAGYNAYRPFGWSLTTGAVTIDGGGAGTTFGGSVSSGRTTVTTIGETKGFSVVDTGVNGANLLLTGNGATTPNKYLRVINGEFNIVNSLYTTQILTLDDVGNLTVPGIITAGNDFIGPGSGFTIQNSTGVGSGGAIQIFDSTHGNGGLNLMYDGVAAASVTSTGLNAPNVVVSTAITMPTKAVGDNSANGASTAYVVNALEGYFPAGTRLPFAQATAPTGWVQDTSDAATNRMMVVVNNSTGNTAAGTNSPILNNVVPAHSHNFTTGTESASHSHALNDPGHIHTFNAGDSGSGSNYGSGNGNDYGPRDGFGAATTGISLYGEDTSHTHSGETDNGSSQTNWTPRYLTMIVCAKS